MTDKEMKACVKKSSSFDENQTLEDYTEFIRDCIYIGKILGRKKRNAWDNSNTDIKNFLWASANKTVKDNASCIKEYHDNRISASEAQLEIEYGCG